VKIGKYYFQREQDLGLYPLFSLELNHRVKQKEATNIVVVGEAGVGKSYMGLQIAMAIDQRFHINKSTVFTYKEYMEEVVRGKMGVPIVFDEPSYAIGKREWYKQINQALVKTIESQRFLVRPLIIPIINQNLLDKTVRMYLVQFQVHIVARGKARVYRIWASQSTDKVYRYFFCTLRYPVLNPECTTDSCLGCKEMSTCDTDRARYERMKEETQMGRYDEGLNLAIQMEMKELTFADIQALALQNEEIKRILHKEKDINGVTLRIIMREDHGIKLSLNKAYELRKALVRSLEKKP